MQLLPLILQNGQMLYLSDAGESQIYLFVFMVVQW